jgi:UDP-N-acetyl-2-amino-2-deoxyglucuronate dehydrogenase
MTVRFGIIGSGYMGRTYAACLTRHVPNGSLSAVTGGRRAPGLAAEFGVDAEPSVDALLDRADVDAVIITSPHSAHRPQAVQAAAAGKHVYIEKPMAITIADCDAVIDACRAAGVRLTVNFVTRFRDAPLAMKGLVDEGAIGDIRMIEMRGVWTGFLLEDIVDEATGRVIIPRKDWAFDPAEGSQFLDWGVHETDALRWLTGSEAVRAFADYRTYGTPPPIDLSAMVHYTMANGVMASLLMTYEAPEPGLVPNDTTRIIGSRGIIEADHYGQVRLGTGSDWRLVAEQVAFDFLGDYLDPNRLKGFAAQVADLADAIEHDREPVVTGEDGRAAVEMVAAADRSAASGEAVTLPLTPALTA